MVGSISPVIAGEPVLRTSDLSANSKIGDLLTRYKSKPNLALSILDKRIQALQNGLEKVDPGDWRTDFSDFSATFAPVSQKSLLRLALCRLYNNRGVINSNAHRFADAERDFRKSISYMERYSNSWSNLAVIQQKLGRSKEAFESFKTALAVNPRSVSALRNKAELEKRLGMVEKAKKTEAEHARVLRQNQEDGVDPELNDLASAILPELEKMPDSALVCTAQGLIHWNHLRFDKAETCYRRGMNCKPINFLPAYNFGRLESWRGKNREAVKLFDAAIAADSTAPMPHLQKALSLKSLGDFSGAASSATTFLKLYEYNDAIRVKALLLRSLCNLARKQHERALQDLTLVNSLNCDDTLKATALLRKANILKQLGRKKDALKEYDKAIELAPNAPLLFKERGELAASLGDFEDGMMDLSKSMHQVESSKRAEISPPTPKQLDAMIAEQTKVINFAPKSESVYYDRGLLYLMRGNFESAIKDFKIVLAKGKSGSKTADAAASFTFVALKLSGKPAADAQAFLNSYASSEQIKVKPAFAFLLGKARLQATIDKLNSVDERTRAFTVLGLHLYTIKKFDEAEQLLEWVATKGNVGADEFPLAISYFQKSTEALKKSTGKRAR